MKTADPHLRRPDEAVSGTVRREPRLLLRTEEYLNRHSSMFIVGLGLALVLLIGIIDIVTGPFLSPSLFYVIPVALVTWSVGRLRGTLIAVASAGMWLAADVAAGLYAADSLVSYWNAVARLAVLYIVVPLLTTLKDDVERERGLAAQEGEAAGKLRALNELKDTLLHAISHDLRGPITAILGSVQSLERSEQLQLTPDQRAGLLNAISVSGRKIDRMLSDLLDLERLDRGVVEPHCSPTDLVALTRRIVDEADYMAEHPVRIESEPVVASVDAAQVERMLDNLLVNAAKHTRIGTPVLVRVRPKDEGVLLTVEDEGPGIPEELKAVIFQPFKQGEPARSKGSGAGIGLSLVAKFAELHGGNASVEDRDGGGTRFKVFLPGIPARKSSGPVTGRAAAVSS